VVKSDERIEKIGMKMFGWLKSVGMNTIMK
jgi:hypothetical protein